MNLEKALNEAYQLARANKAPFVIVEHRPGEYDCFAEAGLDFELLRKACIKVFDFGVYISMPRG